MSEFDGARAALIKCRVLQKGVTATVEITLRATQNAGRAPTMPLEIASENKEMGRVLIRRAGETIAAGEREISKTRVFN